MQEDKREEPPAGVKPPGFCDRLQKAFHARPAFRPLRRLTADKPADAAGAGASPADPAPKHGGPLVPTPPRAPRPAPVRLPAVTTPTSNKKAALDSVATGPPVPTPPPDILKAGVPEADEKAGDKQAQQSKWKNRVGFNVRKALSSK
ncbi:hypothetical protein QOZ80_3AG0248990 [Eleusine coracana subsp. coracana]|nr:hypothetical protein QOZ80_3AG0248990 [Eleusine coracana subsp. coracana]